jgi:hypothetical protein
MPDKNTIDYWELGFNLHEKEPELMAIEVWWRAAKVVLTEARDDQFDFIYGYLAAVKQRSAYEQEHSGEPGGYQTAGCDEHD